MSGEILPTGKRSGSGSQPELRASHADRDRVVEVLRVAAGDGRLTAEELDERLEAALSARTVGDLTTLTADLPSPPTTYGAAVAEAKDVVRFEQRFSAVTRAGRWVVPRRLEIATEWCKVTLDFTQAVITQDTLRIDMDTVGKTLTLVTRPGMVIDTDALSLEHCKVTFRRAPDLDDLATPTTLRVELAGRKTHGRLVVRPPRRTFGRRIRRSPPRSAGD